MNSISGTKYNAMKGRRKEIVDGIVKCSFARRMERIAREGLKAASEFITENT